MHRSKNLVLRGLLTPGRRNRSVMSSGGSKASGLNRALPPPRLGGRLSVIHVYGTTVVHIPSLLAVPSYLKPVHHPLVLYFGQGRIWLTLRVADKHTPCRRSGVRGRLDGALAVAKCGRFRSLPIPFTADSVHCRFRSLHGD
jgi:hypothetical protein